MEMGFNFKDVEFFDKHGAEGCYHGTVGYLSGNFSKVSVLFG